MLIELTKEDVLNTKVCIVNYAKQKEVSESDMRYLLDLSAKFIEKKLDQVEVKKEKKE